MLKYNIMPLTKVEIRHIMVLDQHFDVDLRVLSAVHTYHMDQKWEKVLDFFPLQKEFPNAEGRMKGRHLRKQSRKKLQNKG